MSTSGGVGGQQWQRVTVPTDAGSWHVGTPAFVLADAAVTLPFTIATGVNDTFNYTPSGGAAELFTMAPHVALATLAAVIAAMAAATGSVSGEAFSTKITPSNGGAGKILVTSLSAGVTSNGDTITEGNGGAAALGFTANPDTFAGGVGQLGTVTFNGDGTITLGPVAAIVSNADQWGGLWALEATVNMTANNYPAFQAAYDAVTHAAAVQAAYGTGWVGLFTGTPGGAQTARIGANANLAFDLAVGTHKVALLGTAEQVVCVDGVAIAGTSLLPASFQTNLASSRFYLSNDGTDPVTFSALKAWRIPIPTLS